MMMYTTLTYNAQMKFGWLIRQQGVFEEFYVVLHAKTVETPLKMKMMHSFANIVTPVLVDCL